MSRIDLVDLANLENQSTAVGAVNVNNEILEEIMDKALFRTGDSPNHMQAQLDMNSNRIINLPAATEATDPIRVMDLDDLIPDFEQAQIDIDAAEQAAQDAQDAAAQAINAANSIDVGTLGLQDFDTVSITGGSITGLAAPVSAPDISNKDYADRAVGGINTRLSVRLATAATLPNSPVYAAGTSTSLATITATTSGTLVIDGVTVNVGDRVLVKNQATALHNDIYTVTQATTLWKITKSSEVDVGLKGESIYVNTGSTNADKVFTRTDITPNYFADAVVVFQNSDFATKGELAHTQNYLTGIVTSDVASLENNVNSLITNVTSLDGAVTTLQSDVSDLQDDVAAISTFSSIFNEISDVEAVSVPGTVDVIQTGVYSSATGLGGATYRRVVSEPSHEGKIQSNDGTWWELTSDYGLPTQFGAYADYTTDDLNSINDALDYCYQKNVNFKFGAHTYYVTDTITINDAINFIGDGSKVSKLKTSAAGVAFQITPIDNGSTHFFFGFTRHILKGFTLEHSTDGGTYGIQVSLNQGEPYAYSIWEDLYINKFGTKAFKLDNGIGVHPYIGPADPGNGPAGSGNADGFFVNQFTNCFFYKGFDGVHVGDSINFDNCKFHGEGRITVDQISGAAEMNFKNCSITLSGGARFTSLLNASFDGTWFETVSFVYNDDGANCLLALLACNSVRLNGCTLNCGVLSGPLPANVILIADASHNIEIDNCFFSGPGSDGHIYAPAGTYKITMGDGNNYSLSTPNNVFQGTDTRGWPVNLYPDYISFSNSWVETGSGESPVQVFKHGRRVDLYASLTGGSANNTTAFTLPVEYRPEYISPFTAETNGTMGTWYVASNGVVTVADRGTLPIRLRGSWIVPAIYA